MENGYPSAEVAERELHLAGELNPGPWVEHSINTGLAARYIAERCKGMNPEKAYQLFKVYHYGSRRLR